MKKQGKSKFYLKYMIVTVIILTVGICTYFGYKTYAADDIYLEISGANVSNTTVEMRNKILQLNMKTEGTAYDDTSLYEVVWTIENDPSAQPGGTPADQIASVTQGSSQTIGLVTALSPGTVTVTVTVKDKLNGYAELASTTCNVRVTFSIDTTKDDSIFRYIYEDSTERSLVVYADHDPIQLDLNFGDATNTQWMSGNTEICTVGRTSGEVKLVGSGKTTITATYTPEGSTDTDTAILNVYVIPRVTVDRTEYDSNTFHKSLTKSLERGSYFYLDTYFGENNTEPIGDKITWVIKQDDGINRKVIANSLPENQGGVRSDLITLEPISSQSSVFDIQGKAGVYYIEFYAAGTYESESRKTEAYQPTTVKLTVYADFDDYNETMLVGDSYDLANAFNLTVDDFNKYFITPVLSYGGGSAANYATYQSKEAIINTSAAGVVDVKVAANPIYNSTIQDLTNPASPVAGKTTFNLVLNIMDSFYLDRQSCIVSVGQSLQLNTVMSGSFEGTVEWSSSDTKYVTVNSQGLITGVRATTNVSDIIITASLKSETGAIIKNATCYVKVEPTVSGFSLTPDKISLKVGDNATIKAEIKQSVSVAPLLWNSKDESILKVEPSADNKSAVITALKGGETVVTVTNTLNGEQHYVDVTVLIAIEDLSFDEPIVEAKTYTKVRMLSVSYSPKNANSTDIIWNSSDESIAKIEDSGGENGSRKALVTLGKPGTVILTASPSYNPYTVVATCNFTVVASADSMEITPEEVTLNAAYGDHDAETKQIEYTLTPQGCTTTLTFTSADTKIAKVSDTGLITAVGPGSTIITVQSEENLLKQCKVTVLQPCESLAFSPVSYTMVTGERYTPSLTKKPVNTTDTFTWKSYNTSVATVNSYGEIEAKKVGQTFIQVSSPSGAVAIMELIVRDNVKGLELNYSSYTIEKGQYFDLWPVFTPATAFNKGIEFANSEPSVASIQQKAEDGAPYLRVTGLKGGVTMITVTSSDGGYKASCLVTVTEKSTSVTVNPTSKYLKLGSSFTISATVRTKTATNKNVKWSSSNSKIASVSKGGKVKGKKIGTVNIRATAKDGSGASAVCRVMVVRKVTSLRLNKYSAKLLVGKTLKLKKYIRPKNATIKSVTWSSSDNTIATVGANGRVLGLSPGLVRIRAKANDGSGKSATCLIEVVEPVAATGVTVGQSELIVARGRSIQSGIVVSPANSTDSISYFSDNKKVATVDKRGKIRTKKTGEVTVYGRTSNGKLGYVDVLVVAMNRAKLKMRVYDTEVLRVNEISQGVTWHSSNPLVASVANGKVVGRRPGKTTIYATVRGLRLPCRVTITELD